MERVWNRPLASARRMQNVEFSCVFRDIDMTYSSWIRKNRPDSWIGYSLSTSSHECLGSVLECFNLLRRSVLDRATYGVFRSAFSENPLKLLQCPKLNISHIKYNMRKLTVGDTGEQNEKCQYHWFHGGLKDNSQCMLTQLLKEAYERSACWY